MKSKEQSESQTPKRVSAVVRRCNCNEPTKLDDLYEFINDERDSLIDHVQNDLKIQNCDRELSNLFDKVDEIHYEVSLEDIIDAVRKRVLIAISTFRDE